MVFEWILFTGGGGYPGKAIADVESFCWNSNDLDVSSIESYVLEITSNRIIIKGKTGEGVYRGWQTLTQIIELSQNGDNPNYIPTGKIGFRGDPFWRETARYFYKFLWGDFLAKCWLKVSLIEKPTGNCVFCRIMPDKDYF